MPSALWRISCAVSDAARAEAAMRAFDTHVASISAFETSPGGPWVVEGLSVAPPDAARLEVNLALALGAAAPPLAIERLAPRDWLRENQESFVPFRVGRYFVHGSLWPGAPPGGSIALAIDAATAFGTGEHGSTRGCLLALDRTAHRRRPRRILDMGTGTGILAIAAAKTWRRRVVAADIDAEAVRVARCNAAANRVGSRIAVSRAHTARARAVRAGGPYDLVLANILARPLMLMARDLRRATAPRGIVVLAGILPWQEPALLAAWRMVGLRLARRILVDGWSTLVLGARGADGGISTL